MAKKSKIDIEVTLDKDLIPVDIAWRASDHPQHHNYESVKAMFLAFFDDATKDTLKIDLWTKEMQVEEMDKFIFQVLRSMTDTYVKSTNNRELGNAMLQFAEYFGEQTKVIKKTEE